ncbi:M16 family metallopeptidase [Reichenbachiella versicolor]|uniref:M16 family metallopeptidase n=1 Tax=Reichenbachiella versicolor TaxID=1821036 RepID=UPI000D6DD073|nr:pitrilysin family protein [Reichenbachiella versicolor]
MADYELFEFPNGIRLVHKQVFSTKIAHCAVMLDIGSRDELEHQQGIAHFWEHMAFKGTKKRKAFHIINRLESLGGELNAYTTKEKICFYSAVLEKHLDKSLELLSDITFNSTFPEVQIEKERQVILEEMAMYQDNPEDAIQDQLDTLIYKNHQLGNNILGTEESVLSFEHEDFKTFIDQNLDTGRLVVSSVGSYSMKKLITLVSKYFGDLNSKSSNRERKAPDSLSDFTSHVDETRDLSQAHIGIGRRAYNIHSELKVPFFFLNNILGGHSFVSRLNLALRENNAFVYNIDSSFTPLTDTGYFQIFYATDPSKVKKSLVLVDREFAKLRKTELGKKQLLSAKEQIKGQLAMSEENNQNYMLMMAKSILDYGKIEPLETVFAKIDSLEAGFLKDLSNEMLNLDEMSILRYLP